MTDKKIKKNRTIKKLSTGLPATNSHLHNFIQLFHELCGSVGYLAAAKLLRVKLCK